MKQNKIKIEKGIYSFIYKQKDVDMETIKRGINNPLASWIGGVGLGAVITTSMVLGGYKNSFDSLKDDVKTTKVTVEQIKIDVAVLKTKQETFYK